jgi:O-antigen/teichoic acid export membrane protein
VLEVAASRHLRSVGGTTVALIVSQVMMAVSGVLAARELGPAGRGIVAAVLSWPILLGHLSLIGLNTAASVRIARGRRAALPATLGSAVAHSVVIGGVVTLAAVVVIPPMLAHLGGDAERLAVWALATIPIIVLADILMCINVALGRITFANLCRMIGPFIILGGTVVLVLRHSVTPERIVALTIAAGVVAFAVGTIGLPWGRIALNVTQLFRDLKFGAKAHVASLVGLANVRLDLVLMSTLVAASQVGYYSVANNLMMPVTSCASAAALLITPRIAGMGRGRRHDEVADAQLASIRRDGRLYLLVGAVGGVLLAALTPVFVPLLFGPAFEPVVLLVWVLIPGYIAGTYGALISAGTLGVRRPWVGNVSQLAGLVVTAALLPFLLPRYDALGAAITSTAAYCTSGLVAVFAMRRLVARTASSEPLPPDSAEFASAAPAAAIASRGG